MPLKLVRRKGSPYWYVRGTIRGERVTCSTGTANKDDAEIFKADYESAFLRGNPTGDGDVTFAYAASAYSSWRNPKEPDITNITRLVAVLGEKLVQSITQDDLVQAANVIKFGRHPATKNRAVIRPASAILHYAANNKWCDWLRIKTFREPAPKTRFVTEAHEQWLLEAVTGDENKRLMLLWIFRQGDRISDIVRVRHEDCDLSAMTVRRYISKTDTTVTLPLDDEICSILEKRGKTDGPIFPRRTRWGVNRWLKKHCNGLGLDLTPHMGRHTVG
jgi:integrase